MAADEPDSATEGHAGTKPPSLEALCVLLPLRLNKQTIMPFFSLNIRLLDLD